MARTAPQQSDGLADDRVYAVKGCSKASFAILSSMIVTEFTCGVMYIVRFRREGEETLKL